MDSHSIAPQVLDAAPVLTPHFAHGRNETLAEMAQRDLDAALQLLVERARYITGASGAAIALRAKGEMICRASAGPSAPALGAGLQLNSGLTGECVRTGRVLRCDDAEHDSRVNRESCRALGIRSVMVTPLLREREVIGVFELLADRSYAFEERDVIALERLSEMVLTALDHAEAAHRAIDEINAPHGEPVTGDEEAKPTPTPANENKPEIALVSKPAEQPESQLEPVPAHAAKAGNCQSCGFPVSEGRTFCIDCEEARHSGETPAANGETPAFLSDFSLRQESWFQTHMYTIGTVLMIALTLVLLFFKFR